MLDDCKNFQMSNAVANKRKVIVFVKEWCDIARDAFYEEPLIKELLQV